MTDKGKSQLNLHVHETWFDFGFDTARRERARGRRCDFGFDGRSSIQIAGTDERLDSVVEAVANGEVTTAPKWSLETEERRDLVGTKPCAGGALGGDFFSGGKRKASKLGEVDLDGGEGVRRSGRGSGEGGGKVGGWNEVGKVTGYAVMAVGMAVYGGRQWERQCAVAVAVAPFPFPPFPIIIKKTGLAGNELTIKRACMHHSLGFAS